MNKIEKPLKKERVDTAVKREEVTCFPIVVSANNVETVVLLLNTAEDEILIQVLRALSKYAALSRDYLVTLYNLDVLKNLWHNIASVNVAVRRYSLKLMAQLYNSPGALEILLKDDERILALLGIMLKEPTDKFVQEFLASIFSKVTQSLEGCQKVIHSQLIAISFANLSSSDPDVRKNNLQILTNVLNDPEGAEIVAEGVKWEPLYFLMRDQYTEIQKLAIEAIDKLLSRQKDFLLQKSFKVSNGLTELLHVLETYSSKHLHLLILDVLKNYSQTDDAVTNFYESGCLTRHIQFMHLAPLEIKPRCLAIFLKMAIINKGREMLHLCNIERVICDILSESEVSLWGAACRAATLMCRHCRSGGVMVEKNIVQSVTSIIQDVSVGWEHIKEDAVLLLAELFRVEKKASDVFIDLNGPILLRSYLPSEARAEVTQIGQENIIQCFINMEAFYDARRMLLDKDFFQELMNILENEDLAINKMICEVLCGLMVENRGKDYFIANNGIVLIKKLLEDSINGIKEATCRLIAMSADEITVVDFINEGVMHLLTENKKMCITCPAWRMAIETLLSHHLPAKFYFTNVLTFTDVTKQDFYAMKRHPSKFPELREIIEEHSTMKYTVYLCHFVDDVEFETLSTFVYPSLESLSTEPQMSTRNVNLSRILNDHHLTFYLRKIKNIMVERSIQYNLTLKPKDRIEILGKFVSEQMCGPDPVLKCNNHLIELHQNEIQMGLRSKLLPLGLVRVGGYFERAILFKTLADKLEIPAKLCRGDAPYIWIEVSVLTNTKDNLIDEEILLNWNILRASHIVDLMDKPGNLLPVGSVKAAIYCGQNFYTEI